MVTQPAPVIPQAPITPVAGTTATPFGSNQLAQSINTTVQQILAFDQNAQGNAANGYIKFQNGLIVQWATGTATTATGTLTQTITFPTPFITSVYAVDVSTNQTAGTSAVGQYSRVSNTLENVVVQSITPTSGSTISPTIIAIGV